ncbi:DNA-binding protein [Sphingomonas sp. S-NIH.Pt1_0416]|uniref:DNA-binding protein n=1 Tax=Sphingomonas sp. S-NIH.Pt1_0416 TaxID=1920123 RepID=UPI000F7E6C66|nr:DNA-binding protein [Sphingomonas sp. S-NIH.Pt1_0416]RSU58933.1 DNA-binding protein [Sphingomonas sp. S-NIH.Pt1_0416]
MTQQNIEAPDLLYGLEAIASHVGLTVPQVKWQIARSGWPTFKQGAIVCARRSTLAKHFAAQEAAAQGVGKE